ncbi:MAG: phage holin family protein [Coriobacteriales bacterium]|jgi:putative membrane protein|nr:phage holin family protein [Coriobacteriales bacterium]
MLRIIGTWIITALAVAFAFWLLPGIGFLTPLGQSAWMPTIIFAAVLAVLNAFVKPILQVVSLPITVLTLGIFSLVINTAVIYLARWISNGLFGTELFISGFFGALLAAIIISIVSAVLTALTGIKDNRGSGS